MRLYPEVFPPSAEKTGSAAPRICDGLWDMDRLSYVAAVAAGIKDDFIYLRLMKRRFVAQQLGDGARCRRLLLFDTTAPLAGAVDVREPHL